MVQFATTTLKFMFSGKKISQICYKFLEYMSKCMLFIFVYVYGKGKLPWQDSEYFKLGEFQRYNDIMLKTLRRDKVYRSPKYQFVNQI